MNDEQRINPGHTSIRALLRVVGPTLALAGLIFMAVGMISFFSAFGGGGPPRYFWCMFVGMPLLAIGLGLTKFAFLGSIARYLSGETSPVAKDTFNYLAEGTRPGVRDMASAVREGLAPPTPSQVHCPKCQHANAADARFCAGCGSSLTAATTCPKCGDLSSPGAKYCDHCGQALG